MTELIFGSKKIFGSGHFLNFFQYSWIKKKPQSKIFLYPKISSVMPINHAKEFLKYILYLHTFLSELQIAPIIPILGINVQNMVQALIRTCYLLIWVLQLEFQEPGFRY